MWFETAKVSESAVKRSAEAESLQWQSLERCQPTQQIPIRNAQKKITKSWAKTVSKPQVDTSLLRYEPQFSYKDSLSTHACGPRQLGATANQLYNTTTLFPEILTVSKV